MPLLTGTYQTEHAAKYAAQLCKHFAHKTDAAYEGGHGHVQFDWGRAEISALADRMEVAFHLNDAADAERGRMVIDKHLARFAFREEFEHLDWADVTP